MIQTPTTGQVLNAAQTTYANKVEAIVARLDPSAPPFPSPFIHYAMSQGWTPAECYRNGSELAL